MRIRLDADFALEDHDGTPLQVRLIQTRGIGRGVVYHARILPEFSHTASNYRLDDTTGDTTLALTGQANTEMHPLPSQAFSSLLYRLIERGEPRL